MIRTRRSAERGHADHGWLDTYHTFSFAGYHDPDHVQFGPLRVLNQDRVAPGAGFGTHGHRDMEIVSYVLEGTLEHRDSQGNGSRLVPGDVQVMSAGRGIQHSELNGSPTAPLHFLQVWLLPRTSGTAPRYAERHFPVDARRGRLCQVASHDGAEGSLVIDQDTRIYATLLWDGEEVRLPLAPGRAAWVHVARGAARAGDVALGPGDGAALVDERELVLVGVDSAEVLVFDLPREG